MTVGGQIWVSDGTAAGTTQISEASGVSSTSMAYFVASGSYVFFGGAAGSDGAELWAFPRSLLGQGNPNNPGQPAAYLPLVIAL